MVWQYLWDEDILYSKKKEVFMLTKTLGKPVETMPAVFNDFFKPWTEWYENGWGNTLSVPSVNVTESSGDFKVLVAAPGLKKNDFKIDVDGNMLTISSEKKEEKEEKGEKFSRKEYNYSSFSRKFTLPDGVNMEKIEAAYENGILQLLLPKTDVAKTNLVKHVAIK
jgi:HSP20 family protein